MTALASITPTLTSLRRTDSICGFSPTEISSQTENLPDEPFAVGINLLIALAVGLVAGLLVTGNMRRKLKTVRKQDWAASYVRQGSMNVTRSNDFYLYSTVSKSAKPKNEDNNGGSSTHTSSSGDTFGGSSGKF